jgi:hypothetical protein
MLDRVFAERFAEDWVAGWNARDLDAILAHYDPRVVFRSPRIAAVLGKKIVALSGLDDLRTYWEKALHLAPDLHFDIRQVFTGSDSITIIYRNHRMQDVAETFVFGPDGKVILSISNSPDHACRNASTRHIQPHRGRRAGDRCSLAWYSLHRSAS